MGFVQRDTVITTILSYIGLVLGYINKGVLFIIFLSTEQIGLISIVTAIGVMFAQLANLGTVNSIWKFFPFFRSGDRRDRGLLLFNIITALIGIVLFGSLYILFRDQISSLYIEKSPLFVEYYFWVLIIGVPMVYYFIIDVYLRSMYKNIVTVFTRDVFLRIVVTILLILFWQNIISFELMLEMICFSYVAQTLLLLIYLNYLGLTKNLLTKITIPGKMKQIMWSFSLYSYMNSIGRVFVMTLDVMMISSMIGLGGTGVYSTIIYFTSALMIPYQSLLRVTSPLVAEYWKTKAMGDMKELYAKVSSISVLVGLYLFALVWTNRNEVFSLLPDEFADGVYVFLFLMIGRLFDMYMGLNGNILATSKKYKYDILFTSILILLVFVLNLLLIPDYGIVGASLSTMIAYIGFNLARFIFVWVKFRLQPLRKSQLYSILIGGSLIVFVEFAFPAIDNIWMSLIAKCSVITLLFPVVVYAFKLEPEIVEYVNKILKRK